MNHATLTRLFTPMLSAAALIVTPVMGGTDTASSGKQPIGKNVITEAPKEESVFDKIWALPHLYKNEHNPIIEELSFTGRYQGQFYSADSQKGDETDWDNRRFRLGLEAVMFDKFLKLKADVDSNLNSHNAVNSERARFYERFTDLYARFQFADEFNVTIGKQEPKLGFERYESDRLHQFFERGFFDSMARPEYAAGVTVDGKFGDFGYVVGAFSDDANREFGNFDGGTSIIGSVYYDFAKSAGLDKGVVRLDYIHSDIDSSKDTVLSTFDNAAALWTQVKSGPFGFYGQANYGHVDKSDANVWGLILMPSYDITKQLQFVARYQLGVSDNDTGISLRKRYEGIAGGGAGDLYNAGYLGLQYFIYGDKLKLMTGVEYANMDGPVGYDGWTYLAGVRVYW